MASPVQERMAATHGSPTKSKMHYSVAMTPSRHQEDRLAQRPPGEDLRLLRDRKIATRLRRDGAESLGFCGTATTQHTN